MQPRVVSSGFHGTRGKPLRWVLSQPGLAEDPIPTLSPSLSSLPPPAGPQLAGDVPPDPQGPHPWQIPARCLALAMALASPAWLLPQRIPPPSH